MQLPDKTEVHNIGLPRGVIPSFDHYVGGLYVSVYHTQPVSGVESLTDLSHHLYLLFQIHLRCCLFQGWAVYKLHGDIGLSFYIAYLIDLADILMIDAGLRLGLSGEALEHIRI